MMADSGACTVFVSAGNRTLVEAAELPASVRQIAIGFASEGWEAGDALLAAAPDSDPGVRNRPEDRFNIIYSSGTTGLPKGIVQSHAARTHFAWSNALELGMSRDSVALVTTALYSNGTMFMVLPPLLLGGTVVIMEQFSAAGALALIAQHRITHAFMVPTQCIVTLDDPALAAHDLSSLKCLLSAGSSLRPDTREAVIAQMTPHVYELYGFSEGFATMRKPGDAPARPGAVGRPVIGFDLRIVRGDDRECGRGEVGEIVGTGLGAMAGYHNRPDLDSAILWRSPSGEAFLRSGDLGLCRRGRLSPHRRPQEGYDPLRRLQHFSRRSRSRDRRASRSSGCDRDRHSASQMGGNTACARYSPRRAGPGGAARMGQCPAGAHPAAGWPGTQNRVSA